MADDISDYEKQRLANIARNQDVLEQLGLAKKKEPAQSSSMKLKEAKPDVVSAPTLPSRIMPKRGLGPKNYNDYFSQHYNALDELEEECAKIERQSSKRKIRPVQKYDDADYDSSRPGSSRKKRHRISEVCVDNMGLAILGEVAETQPILFAPHPVVEDDMRITARQFAKLFAFRFTPTQMKDAAYPDDAVKAFQLYCDERAHLRYSCLTANHCDRDIISVAKAISDGSDTNLFDQTLVKDYFDAVQCFECNSKKLAPPTSSYRSINPKVYCPYCNNIFACTDAGTIRAHSGCTSKRSFGASSTGATRVSEST